MLIDVLPYQIIIAPSHWHSYLLQLKLNVFPHDFKLITKEELCEGMNGKIMPQALPKIMEAFHYSCDKAQILINNCFIDDYVDDKRIGEVFAVQEFIKKHNLFTLDEYYYLLIEHKNVLIVGYGQDDREITRLLSRIDCDHTFCSFEIKEKRPEVFHFSTINEEVFYAFNQIMALVKEGESLNHLRIVYLGSDYEKSIAFMGKQFHLENLVSKRVVLFAFPKVQDIIRHWNNYDFSFRENLAEEEIEAIKLFKMAHLEEIPSALAKEIFIALSKKTTVELAKAQSCLEVTSQLTYSNKKTIMLGFNQGTAPAISKDIDFLPDSIKKAIGRMTSRELNRLQREALIDFITHESILFLSYKFNADGVAFYPSPLIKELKLRDQEGKFQRLFVNDYNNLLLGSAMDLQRKYNQKTYFLDDLERQLTIDYMTFDNKFRPFDVGLSEQKLSYSYSKIKTFFECQFAYYLKSVLQLEAYEDTFATKFGKVAHAVIEHAYDADYDFEKLFNTLLRDYVFSEEEMVIVNRYQEELKIVINNIRTHYQEMQVKAFYNEQVYQINLHDKMVLKGVIDKIIVTTDGVHDYYSIIDNKTGVEEFKAAYLPYGLSLQLPVYSLLLLDDLRFQDMQLIGLYIQPLIINKIGIPQEAKANFFQKNLKLKGLSSNNAEALRTFDPSLDDSRYIANLKTLKSGEFRASAKVADNETFLSYAEMAKKKLLEADYGIRHNDFRINPKIINGKNIACSFCPFMDICNRRDDDLVYIETDESDGDENVDE